MSSQGSWDWVKIVLEHICLNHTIWQTMCIQMNIGPALEISLSPNLNIWSWARIHVTRSSKSGPTVCITIQVVCYNINNCKYRTYSDILCNSLIRLGIVTLRFRENPGIPDVQWTIVVSWHSSGWRRLTWNLVLCRLLWQGTSIYI